jgi:hypothetical protein
MPGDDATFYTLSGEFVVKITAVTTLLQWDGRNKNGARVSEGVYYYVIQRGSEKRKVGKVFVLNDR